MASIDGLPSLISDFRQMKSRLAQAEREVYGRAAMAAQVQNLGPFSVGDSSLHTVTFNSAVFDPQGMWNGGTTLTLPREGVWMVTGTALMGGNGSSGQRQLSAPGLSFPLDARIYTDGLSFLPVSDAKIGYADKGTQVSLRVLQGSGGSEDVSNCSLAVAYVGAVNL